MKKKSKHPTDSRLSKREFRTFVTMVADQMPGADAFEYFVEFLSNSVEVGFILFLLFIISGRRFIVRIVLFDFTRDICFSTPAL